MTIPPKPLPAVIRAKSLWYKWGLVVLLALALLIAWKAYAYTEFFSENFETYNFGAISGQNNWVGAGWVGNTLPPYEYPVKSGEKSLYGYSLGTTYKNFTSISEGISSFWLYLPFSTSFNTIQYTHSGTEAIFIYFPECFETYCTMKDGWNVVIGDVDFGAWANLQVRWSGKKWQSNFNNAGWGAERNFNDTTYADLNRFSIYGLGYIDKIGGEVSTEPQIIAISPASATTITSLSTNLIFDYENLDWDTYDGFIINFKDSKGVRATSKLYEEDDLDPSGTGSETIALSEFDIDQNGNWYLTGYAYGTTAQFGGNPPVLYGTIDIYSDELVLDNYYLNFNVEGLSEPYTFASSTDWYSENVDRFASSTAMFSAFVGLLSPIFEKVGDFGVRVQGMFNQTEAYDRGFSLGEVFPILNGYVAKIDKFFGSFPLASFLKYAILVMLGIFIVKAVLHFIPFFH